jgi:hypothetical protein
MKIPQISVFLENKSGRLAHITRVLRQIVDDTELAKKSLADENVVCMVNDVTAVEVDNRPGGLAAILDALEGADVNVEYMYAYAEGQSEKAALIFRFDDPETAVEKLGQAGINVLS